MPFSGERPLYAQMLGAGYTVLGTAPLREVVLGRVGQLWRPFAPEPRVKSKRAFEEFDAGGHVKILLSFRLAPERRGSSSGTLTTATLQIWNAGSSGGVGLRALWPGISAVGSRISRSFLEALDTRTRS